MSRTIAIGDVHGCDLALAALLNHIAPGADDTVVQLGDLIDRGPNSSKAIDCMQQLALGCRVVQLIGDHEELMLDAYANESALARWLRNGGGATLASYGWSAGMAIHDLPQLQNTRCI